MTELETILTTRPELVIGVPLLVLLAMTAFIDIREHRIPNELSLGAAAIGVSMQAALLGPAGAVLGVLGWAAGLICFMPFYIGRGMGAGDVKLMAGVGAFLGPVNVFFACIATLIAGSVLGIAYLASRKVAELLARRACAEGAADAATADGDVVRYDKMPYAAAIAIGTAVVVLEPPFLASLLPIGAWS